MMPVTEYDALNLLQQQAIDFKVFGVEIARIKGHHNPELDGLIIPEKLEDRVNFLRNIFVDHLQNGMNKHMYRLPNGQLPELVFIMMDAAQKNLKPADKEQVKRLISALGNLPYSITRGRDPGGSMSVGI